MVKKEITIAMTDELVQHPIAMFVQVASQFDSRIYVESSSMKINAKSIMGMMTLGIEEGKTITVSADGTDEDLAMDKIASFLTTGA